jgi:hypothetical protein
MKSALSILKGDLMGISDPLDEIWNGPGIDRQSVVNNFGLEFAKEANRKMPFLLKRKGGLPIDVAAADYGFADDQDLLNHILNYLPKKERLAKWEDQYLAFLFSQESKETCPF